MPIFAAAPSIEPAYDVKPMAQAIKQLQAQGVPVANAANYHAQYQFLGRLEKPLVMLRGAELPRRLAAHPEGFVVIYLRDMRDLPAVPTRHVQAYRGGAAVLVDARTAARLLAAHVE